MTVTVSRILLAREKIRRESGLVRRKIKIRMLVYAAVDNGNPNAFAIEPRFDRRGLRSRCNPSIIKRSAERSRPHAAVRTNRNNLRIISQRLPDLYRKSTRLLTGAEGREPLEIAPARRNLPARLTVATLIRFGAVLDDHIDTVARMDRSKVRRDLRASRERWEETKPARRTAAIAVCLKLNTSMRSSA